jgi:hypothetical protein
MTPGQRAELTLEEYAVRVEIMAERADGGAVMDG